jgi:membrane protein implicated in regulation of membrane protease activity
MSGSAPPPSREDLPPRFVALSLAIVVYTVAGLAVSTLYSQQVGLFMLSPVVVLVAVLFVRIPRNEWSRIAAGKEKQKHTFFGRIIWLIETAVVLYVLIMVGSWLYERL